MEFYFKTMVYTTINYFFECIDEVMSYFIRRFLRSVVLVLRCFVIPYSTLFSIRTKDMKLPKITNPLLEIPAITLAHMIRTKQLKSEEIVQAYINRCKEVNPLINAIVENRFEKALDEARSVDNFIAKNVKTIGEMEKETPILGLPISVKESISVKGMRNQSGVIAKDKQIAQNDAPSIEQLKKHGGIIICVTNTPEYCMQWETYNKISGLTRNPYDLKRTPAGSSGGEAALIGSAGSLLGVASDIAGSVRLPAMFTGIYSHKPTPHFISPQGHVPQSSADNWGNFFTIAPMTRYACDLPLLLKCLSDPCAPELPLNNIQDIKIENIKFFYMNNDGPSGCTSSLDFEISQALEDVAIYFGAKKVNLNMLKYSLEVSMSALLRIKNVETIFFKEGDKSERRKVLSETLRYLSGVSDYTLGSIAIGHLQNLMNAFPESRHKKLAKKAETLKQQFRELLKDDGVFIYPTFPRTAHKHYEIFYKLIDTSYMMIFNTIGLPSTNCMIRLDKHNLPIGIQVITNPGRDHLGLAVAAAIENQFGGWVKPPSED